MNHKYKAKDQVVFQGYMTFIHEPVFGENGELEYQVVVLAMNKTTKLFEPHTLVVNEKDLTGPTEFRYKYKENEHVILNDGRDAVIFEWWGNKAGLPQYKVLIDVVFEKQSMGMPIYIITEDEIKSLAENNDKDLKNQLNNRSTK